MSISDFFNAVSAGNTEKLKAFHSEHPQLPLNRNIHAPAMLGPRLARLPLVIAFYNGRLETAQYLWRNGADLDVICEKCQKTPREFMPEGFSEGSCRIMSFKVFKERVYEAAFSSSSGHQKQKILKRMQKGEEYIKEMYEFATNEELFCTSGTAAIKHQWSEEKLREWLHVSKDITFEEKLKHFRNGDYLWPYILTTARRFV